MEVHYTGMYSLKTLRVAYVTLMYSVKKLGLKAEFYF